MPVRKRKEVQEMSRTGSRRLAGVIAKARLSFAILLGLAGTLFAAESGLWNEYGLAQADTGKQGHLAYTAYRFKDVTGALAAWEWQRSPAGKSCQQAPYCTQDGARTVIFHNNYVVEFKSADPKKADVDAVLTALPKQSEGSLPAILTFLPRQGLVPDTARYILGKESLDTFAPELSGTDPGFSQEAEGQIAQYHLDNGAGNGSPVHLAIFYYPTPDMARQHTIKFKMDPALHVKRSDFLVAIVYGGATDQQADSLLSRVQYEAKITWNDIPPPSPIKPLYRLLVNIMYASGFACALGLTAGLFYAGTRIYRRRFGQLDSEESMTRLDLT